jgi:hypothetical protein
MGIQNKIILVFAMALATTAAVSAQDGSGSALPDEVGVAITLQVAGQPYHFEGKAVCHHAPVASIYNVMSEMWNLRQIDSRRAIALTLWHPQNAPNDMFSLSVQIGNKAYIVDTVKSGKGRAGVGSGKLSFTTSGTGGTFTINATAADGAAITGTIKCSGFSAAMAEGG